jgi:hypothetical protein
MKRAWTFAAFVAVSSAVACGSFGAAPTTADAGSTSPDGAGAGDAGADRGSSATTDAGPVVLYTFAEGSGTTVKDVSGVAPALDLVIDDQSAAAWSGAGLSLIGSGARVSTVVSATKLDGACIANGFTAEVWVRPDKASYEGPARILTHSVKVDDTRFFIGAGQNSAATASDRWVFRVASAAGDVGVDSVGALTSDLHHVVGVVRPNADATLYVDAVPRATALVASALAWAPAPLVLGGEIGAVDRRFTGTYARVAIHCRAFSAEDVRAAYDAGSGH